jgi:hypothetical protein
VLLKLGASARRVAAALIIKSWFSPALTASLTAGWDVPGRHAALGVALAVDDDRDRRYERGAHSLRTGSLVRQERTASRAEAAVARGERWAVQGGPGEREALDARLEAARPPAKSLTDLL